MRSLNLDQLRIFLAWSSAEVLCRGTTVVLSAWLEPAACPGVS